jgi:hypothetical protein
LDALDRNDGLGTPCFPLPCAAVPRMQVFHFPSAICHLPSAARPPVRPGPAKPPLCGPLSNLTARAARTASAFSLPTAFGCGFVACVSTLPSGRIAHTREGSFRVFRVFRGSNSFGCGSAARLRFGAVHPSNPDSRYPISPFPSSVVVKQRVRWWHDWHAKRKPPFGGVSPCSQTFSK